MALHSSVCTKMHPKIISTKSLLKAKKKDKERIKRTLSNFGQGNCMQKRINLSICISTPNSIRKF
jgi:hypothetical protein